MDIFVCCWFIRCHDDIQWWSCFTIFLWPFSSLVRLVFFHSQPHFRYISRPFFISWVFTVTVGLSNFYPFVICCKNFWLFFLACFIFWCSKTSLITSSCIFMVLFGAYNSSVPSTKMYVYIKLCAKAFAYSRSVEVLVSSHF